MLCKMLVFTRLSEEMMQIVHIFLTQLFHKYKYRAKLNNIRYFFIRYHFYTFPKTIAQQYENTHLPLITRSAFNMPM